MRKSQKAAGLDTAFQKLQRSYGLQQPGQIKLKILWFHLQQLVLAKYPGPESERVLSRYDQHWKLCEMIEAKKRKPRF